MSLQQITTGDINTSATPTLAGLTVTSNIASSNVTVSGNLNVTGTPTFTNTISAPNTFGFKNRIINGGMQIDQRNNGAAVTNTGGTTYFVDRWLIYDGSGGSHFSIGQNKGGVTPPAGFTNYIGINVISPVSASSVNNFTLQQYIEGYSIADLAWGTANAKTVTLSFWVYCSLTGTFGGSLRDIGSDYYYPFSFSIPVANTWTQISLTITGATGGTWNTTNGRGICLAFDLGQGSASQGGGAAWTTSQYGTPAGVVPLVGTNGANYYITGVQLEVGAQATSFDYRPYGTELQLCQRYYAKLGATYSNYAAFGAGTVVTTTQADIFVKYPVTMRGAATATVSGGKINAGTSSSPISSISSSYPGTDSIYISFATSAGGMTVAQGALVCANNNAPDFLAFSAEL